MDKFNRLYEEIINFKIACESLTELSQKLGGPGYLSSPENFNFDDIFFVDDNHENVIIYEEVYRRSMFDKFINLIKTHNLYLITYDEMKSIFKRRLIPVKSKNKIFIFKFIFSDKNDFIVKLNMSIQGGYEQNTKFFDRLYECLQQYEGACWRCNDDTIIMFFNEDDMNETTIMHECIHYIQTTTGRSMLKQTSSLKDRYNELFNEHEFYAYLNTICHIFEKAGTSYESIMRYIDVLENRRSDFDSENDFVKFAIGIDPIKCMTDIQCISSIKWLIISVFYDKHIAIIKNHIIRYFK